MSPVLVSESVLLAQAWMSDTQQEVFADSVLLRFAPSVYRDIQRFMTQNGEPRLKGYATFTVPAQTLAVDEQITGFPTNVVKPIKLWERATGAAQPLIDYLEIEEAFPYLIPRVQTGLLSHWEWKNGQLLFIGANVDREVRMYYSQLVPDIVDANSVILIRDAADALALGMVAAAARSHGSPMYDSVQAIYERTLNQLVDRDQPQPKVERRPRWFDRPRVKPGKEVPSNV